MHSKKVIHPNHHFTSDIKKSKKKKKKVIKKKNWKKKKFRWKICLWWIKWLDNKRISIHKQNSENSNKLQIQRVSMRRRKSLFTWKLNQKILLHQQKIKEAPKRIKNINASRDFFSVLTFDKKVYCYGNASELNLYHAKMH